MGIGDFLDTYIQYDLDNHHSSFGNTFNSQSP